MDREACYRAFQTRDARFDGRIFVGVTSTGIYCRPICPARTPKFENCRFFASAAAAQEAGFRPCLRCRPETAPELAFWRGTSNTVSRALALIAEGALDGRGRRRGVRRAARRRRAAAAPPVQQHLGASPIAVAQTRRVLFAKQLIHDTRLPMAEVALAAGFGSVRRFNETFRKLSAARPSALRRNAGAAGRRRRGDGVTLRLSLSSALRLAGACSTSSRPAPSTKHRARRGRRLASRSIEIDGKKGSVVGGAPARAQRRRRHHPLPRRARRCPRSSPA